MTRTPHEEAVEAIRQAREAYGKRVTKARHALLEGRHHLRPEVREALATNVITETLTLLQSIDAALERV